MLTAGFEGSVGLQGDAVEVAGVLNHNIREIGPVHLVLRGDFLAHLKKFFEVPFEAAFGMFLSKPGIAPLAGGPGDFVGAFGGKILSKKSLNAAVQGVGLGFAQAVIAYGDKAHLLVGLAQFADKGGSLFGGSGQKVLQIHRGYAGSMGRVRMR